MFTLLRMYKYTGWLIEPKTIDYSPIDLSYIG